MDMTEPTPMIMPSAVRKDGFCFPRLMKARRKTERMATVAPLNHAHYAHHARRAPRGRSLAISSWAEFGFIDIVGNDQAVAQQNAAAAGWAMSVSW
jgi:hypothetical protein